MKILINQPALYPDDNLDCIIDGYNYNLNCELDSNEDSTAYDVTNMVFHAMMVEGYAAESIIQAMYDTATYEAFNKNIKIKTDKE